MSKDNTKKETEPMNLFWALILYLFFGFKHLINNEAYVPLKSIISNDKKANTDATYDNEQTDENTSGAENTSQMQVAETDVVEDITIKGNENTSDKQKTVNNAGQIPKETQYNQIANTNSDIGIDVRNKKTSSDTQKYLSSSESSVSNSDEYNPNTNLYHYKAANKTYSSSEVIKKIEEHYTYSEINDDLVTFKAIKDLLLSADDKTKANVMIILSKKMPALSLKDLKKFIETDKGKPRPNKSQKVIFNTKHNGVTIVSGHGLDNQYFTGGNIGFSMDSGTKNDARNNFSAYNIYSDDFKGILKLTIEDYVEGKRTYKLEEISDPPKENPQRTMPDFIRYNHRRYDISKLTESEKKDVKTAIQNIYNCEVSAKALVENINETLVKPCLEMTKKLTNMTRGFPFYT